jgi:hypothetical protein
LHPIIFIRRILTMANTCSTTWVFWSYDMDTLQDFIEKIRECVPGNALFDTRRYGIPYEFVAAALRDDSRIIIEEYELGSKPKFRLETSRPDGIWCKGSSIQDIGELCDGIDENGKEYQSITVWCLDKWNPNTDFWEQMIAENEKFSAINKCYIAEEPNMAIYVNSDKSRKFIPTSYFLEYNLPPIILDDGSYNYLDDSERYATREELLNELNDLIKVIGRSYKNHPEAYNNLPEEGVFEEKESVNEAVKVLRTKCAIPKDDPCHVCTNNKEVFFLYLHEFEDE